MAMNPRLLRPLARFQAPSEPPEPTTLYYYDPLENGNWDDAGVWWLNEDHTSLASFSPRNGDDLVLLQTVDFGAPRTMRNLTIAGGSLGNSAIVTGVATFTGAANQGTVTGNATFTDAANVGTVTGNVTFNGSSGNEGTVDGNATFNDISANQGTVTGNATFNGSSGNEGTVDGTATFNDSACNDGGTAGTFVPATPPECD
jgi:hypothetical protein